MVNRPRDTQRVSEEPARFSYVDHVGFSVPNLDEAVSFFVGAFGAEELYRSRRVGEGAFMLETFDAPSDSSFELAMLRLPPNINIELFQWSVPSEAGTSPPLYAAGGHHLCLYSDDIEAAYSRLAQIPGVRMLGRIKTVPPGSPVAGTKWTYLVSPWGLHIEIVNRADVGDRPRFIVPR